MAKHQFQTEVGQLLHLMTHSLYSNKEIFIRELVSNSSDAIDKLNYLRLTDENLKDAFADWKGEINITFDEADKSLTIIDNGIGMNEEDMETIAEIIEVVLGQKDIEKAKQMSRALTDKYPLYKDAVL